MDSAIKMFMPVLSVRYVWVCALSSIFIMQPPEIVNVNLTLSCLILPALPALLTAGPATQMEPASVVAQLLTSGS